MEIWLSICNRIIHCHRRYMFLVFQKEEIIEIESKSLSFFYQLSLFLNHLSLSY